MGTDKASLAFGNSTLLERALAIAGDVADDVIAVSPRPLTSYREARVVIDRGEGPLVALASALAETRTDRVLLLACDMPLARPALLRRLFDLIGEQDAAVPRVDGVPVPTCAVYKRDVAAVARALVSRGERSLRALLAEVSVRWVEETEMRDADPDLVSFLDCDTPEDYARALALADRWD